ASATMQYHFTQGILVGNDITYTEGTYGRDAMGRITTYTENDYDTIDDFGFGNTGVISGAYSRSAVYNADSQATSDRTSTIRSDNSVWTTATTYDYLAESSPGSNVYTGAYMGGLVTHQSTQNTGGGSSTTADLRTYYTWFDSAESSQQDYDDRIHSGGTY